MGGKVDKALAQKQWDGLKAAIEDQGVQVSSLLILNHNQFYVFHHKYEFILKHNRFLHLIKKQAYLIWFLFVTVAWYLKTRYT